MTPPTDRPAAASAPPDEPAAVPEVPAAMAAGTASPDTSVIVVPEEKDVGPVVTVASVPVTELESTRASHPHDLASSVDTAAAPAVGANNVPIISTQPVTEPTRAPTAKTMTVAATAAAHSLEEPGTLNESVNDGRPAPERVNQPATSVPPQEAAPEVTSGNGVSASTPAPSRHVPEPPILPKPAAAVQASGQPQQATITSATAGVPPASELSPKQSPFSEETTAADASADSADVVANEAEVDVAPEKGPEAAAASAPEMPPEPVAITPPATPPTLSGPVQVAVFGKHPSHDDFYFFDDAGSDPRLAWFESAIARQMRDAHPGDAPGCHDRWLLWLLRGRVVVAAAWDSRDSRGRPRTPLFACVAVDQSAGTPFVRDAVAWLQALRTTLNWGETPDRAAFVAAVHTAAGSAQEIEVSGQAEGDRLHVGRAANDVLRAVGIADLNAAATLFPQAGFGAKLRRAGRMLRAFSGKSQPEPSTPGPCVDGHCRFHQQGLDAAASLEGWASLAEMTRQSGPLGVIVGENGVVDLYAARPEAVDLSHVYDKPGDE